MLKAQNVSLNSFSISLDNVRNAEEIMGYIRIHEYIVAVKEGEYLDILINDMQYLTTTLERPPC